MYDENQLFDELVGTVKSTGQSAMNLIELLNRLKGGAEPVNQNSVGNQDFSFTGQSTDLEYFRNNSQMHISEIERIPDERVKNAVKDEFRKAELDGKIKFDEKNGTFSLTEKGKKFIDKPEFKTAYAENVSKMRAETQLQAETINFELTGTVQDLNYFNFADELNLNTVIESSNTKAVENVLSNLNKMKESGLISVSDNVVKITDKGKNVLNSDLFKLSAKNSTVASVGSTANSSAVASAGSTAGGAIGIAVMVAKKVVDATANLIKK